MDFSQLHNLSIFEIEPQSESTLGTRISADNMSHNTMHNPSSIAKPLLDGTSAASDLGKFLERKVQIYTTTVAVGAALVDTFNPWTLFLNNTVIKNKLQNYSMLRGNMVITIDIAGTPFHKGMFIASYRYLNVADDAYIGQTALDTTRGIDVVKGSQRPHLYLNASTNKGGCMCIPFLHPMTHGHLSLPPTIAFSNMGFVELRSLPFGLEQINGGTDEVTITVFAHMTDTDLTAPTSRLVALSGSDPFIIEPQSEYADSGVISGPASAVAEISGALSSVPYIGPFALATSIGASAVSGIARLFGYSKPTNIKDVSRMRNTPVTNLALTDGSDNSQKLTVTSKAELTIDQTTVGMPADDNLALYFYTKKESFVRSLVWPVTATVGSVPFMIECNPMIEYVSTDLTDDALRIQQTSLSSVTRLFSEWSGGLRFRIQVIASQYHRGKIAVVYEPNGATISNPYPSNYHTIIDLAEGRDFTIDVKWQQAVPYRPVFVPTVAKHDLFSFTSAGSVTPDVTSNGALYFVVVNELTVPDGLTGVTFAISLSAMDDFELVNPSSELSRLSYTGPIALSGSDDWIIEPQSAAVDVLPEFENAPEAEGPSVEVTDSVVTTPDKKAIMYYGERVTSLRQLFKRFTFYRRIKANYAGVGKYGTMAIALKALPASRGAIGEGFDTVTGAAVSYNLVGNSYFAHIYRGFAGWRGSMRYKFLNLSSTLAMRVERLTGVQRNVAVTMVPYFTTTSNLTGDARFYASKGLRSHFHSPAGTVATQNRTMDSLEVEIPYTIPLNFSVVRTVFNAISQNTLSNGYPAGDAFSLSSDSDLSTTEPLECDIYVATGEDISLFGYNGACRISIEEGLPEPTSS